MIWMMNLICRFKLGDAVRRCDGAKDYQGKPYETEGIITKIEDGRIEVAKEGNLNEILLFFSEQLEKINKKYKLHKDGKIKLF